MIGSVEVLDARTRVRTGDLRRRGEYGVLQRAILEHGLDHEVAVGQVGAGVGAGHPAEHLVATRGREPSPADPLVQQGGDPLPAGLGGVGRDVLQNDLDAGVRTDVGDARAHHPGPEDAQPAHGSRFEARWPGRATQDLVTPEPQGADHVLRHLAGHELEEVPALHRHGRVDVDGRPLDRGRQDPLGRGIGAVGTTDEHGRCDGQGEVTLGVVDRRAGKDEPGPVPRLGGFGPSPDPGHGLRKEIVLARGELVHQPGLDRGGRPQLRSLHEQR